MSAEEMESEGIKLLGSGIKLSPPTKSPRLYPGDLVCYKASKPYEWMPWYGVVLSPNSYFAQYAELKNKKKNGSSSDSDFDIDVKALEIDSENPPPEEAAMNDETEESITWSPDDGLPNPVYVQWSHSNSIGKVCDPTVLTLVDRELQKGQRVKNEDGIIGTVVDRTVKATLQVLNTNHIIDAVHVGDLKPVSAYVRGREIQYRGWVGVITAVRRNITCRLDNGGVIFKLKTNESDGFMKVDPFWGNGMPCPGIRNKFSPAVMKSATFTSRMMRFVHRWIPPISYLYTRSESTTIGVDTSAIDVMWLQQCPTSTDEENTPPPETIPKSDFSEMKPLGLPNYATVGIKSVRIYSIQPEDTVVNYATWYAGFQAKFYGAPATSHTHFISKPNVATPNLLCQTGYELPVKIIFRQAEVEIEWDNGVTEFMLAARVPILLPSASEGDFQPGLVVESVLETSGKKKYGVVLDSSDFEMSDTNIVKVRWILPESESDDGQSQDLGVKKESFYDLKPHSSICMYQIGTTVFIKDHPTGYGSGTVVDLDIRQGKLLVAVPESKPQIPVYPHSVTPLMQRSYWNFFNRDWVNDSLVPPLYQHINEGVGIPKELAVPLSLSVKNNNQSTSRIRVGDILDEPAFGILDSPPQYHRYSQWSLKNTSSEFLRAMRTELMNLKDAELPNGVWIRGYETRNDLYSALMLGPENTPYEDGLFFFDLQLSENFPEVPPRVHHIPYTTQPVSPFIASEGAFCMSGLKWEFESPPKSYVASIFAQIQRQSSHAYRGGQREEVFYNVEVNGKCLFTFATTMVFTSAPYFKQMGNEVELGTPEGEEKSRAYNERIYMNIFTAFYKQVMAPYDPWRHLIAQHLSLCLPYKVACIKDWLKLTEAEENEESTDKGAPTPLSPTFNLLPVSKGFQHAIGGRVRKLEELIPRRVDEGGVKALHPTSPNTLKNDTNPSSSLSNISDSTLRSEEESETEITDVRESEDIQEVVEITTVD